MGDFFGIPAGSSPAAEVFALVFGVVMCMRLFRYFLRIIGLG